MSPGEREAAMSRDDEDGYIFVKPLLEALPKFENSEPSMKLFFPDLVRAIDVGGETKRLAAVKFAPSETTKLVDETAGDRKSTRLNSSHRCISYAVFCLKKKKFCF